jgi:hypothetical protein
MRKKIILSILGVLALLAAGSIVYIQSGPPAAPELSDSHDGNISRSSAVEAVPARQTIHPPGIKATQKAAPRTVSGTTPKSAEPEADEPFPVTDPIPRDLEGIKSYIYADEIEYLDDIPVLDELVQVRNRAPEELWGGDWGSVDDWKRRQDNFRLEQTESGFTFTSPKDGVREFLYEEETGDFVWEMDYYGKIISQRAKFLTEDTLAMMIISGDKVAVSLYQKGALPESEEE